MDKTEFNKYLNDRYTDQINWYDRKSLHYQTLYRWFQWGLIILAALTPVFVTLQSASKEYPDLVWVPVLSSVLVAILATGLKAFRFQENWINYRTTCETLRKEIYLYQADVGEYGTEDDKERLFVERVESLISRENTLWLTSHKEQPAKKKSQ